MQLMEDCLGRGFIADDGANVVAFQEVGEDSKVAGSEDLREEVDKVGGGWWLDCRVVGVCEDGGVRAKGGGELREGFQKAVVAVIVGKPVVFIKSDIAAHAAGNGCVGGGSRC